MLHILLVVLRQSVEGFLQVGEMKPLDRPRRFILTVFVVIFDRVGPRTAIANDGRMVADAAALSQNCAAAIGVARNPHVATGPFETKVD